MKFLSWALLIIALITVGFIFLSGSNEKILTVGDLAADLRSEDLQGKYFFFNEHRGEVILLNFAATYCAHCLEELPYLEKLKQKYAEAGLTVTSVFKDHINIELISEFKEKNRLSFPVLTDRDGVIFQRFGVRALPYTVIIDRNGVVRYCHTGFRSGDIKNYEREIKSLLQGNE